MKTITLILFILKLIFPYISSEYNNHFFQYVSLVNNIDFNKTTNITSKNVLNKTDEIIKRSIKIESDSDLYMIITFVNGIYHSEEDVQEITEYIETTFKCDVRSFYNPSSGNWVKDATKAGFELVLRPNDLELAKNLAEHLRKTLKELRPKGRILHIAHSGGAILTYLAVKYHLTYNEANRIDIVTLGGGRSLTHKYFKGRIFNYYSRNDPVLLVEKRAAKLMKVTKNDTYDIVRDTKHNTTFVFLEPIAKDPIFDHSMGGPTYRLALHLEAIEFQRRLQYMMNLAAKDKDLIRKFRKTVANITGIRHFWSNYITSSSVNIATTSRMLRKYSSNITNIHGLFSGKGRNNQKIQRAITHTGQVLSENHVITMNNTTSYNETNTINNINTTITINMKNHNQSNIITNQTKPSKEVDNNLIAKRHKYNANSIQSMVDRLHYTESR